MIALAQLYSTYLPRPFQLKIPCWINSDDNYESSVGDRTSWSTHTAAVWIQVTFWDADCLSGPSGFLDFLFLWKHQFLLLSLQEGTWLLPVIFSWQMDWGQHWWWIQHTSCALSSETETEGLCECADTVNRLTLITTPAQTPPEAWERWNPLPSSRSAAPGTSRLPTSTRKIAIIKRGTHSTPWIATETSRLLLRGLTGAYLRSWPLSLYQSHSKQLTNFFLSFKNIW